MHHPILLTETKKARIYQSVQYLLVMAEMIKLEHMTDLVDARFKNPQCNQFAKRIASDATAIQVCLKQNDRLNIQVSDVDFVTEYAAELWQLFHYFIQLPLSQLKEIMDGLINAKIEVEARNDEQPELYQVIYDTINYSFIGAHVEGKDREYAIKNASEAICDLVKHNITREFV